MVGTKWEMPEYAEHEHLGGYIIGGDEATYCPDLWKWLVEDYGVCSVIDVGCGEGHALNYFAELGCDVCGVDGVEQPDPRIIKHDYTKGKLGAKPLQLHYDLCWSCEFVEHVEERYIPNFLETFACAELILMTHAEPGQLGYHHVNCQSASYWVGAMAGIGYALDEKLTAVTRELSLSNRSLYNHFARSGLAFVTSASHDKMNGECL